MDIHYIFILVYCVFTFYAEDGHECTKTYNENVHEKPPQRLHESYEQVVATGANQYNLTTVRKIYTPQLEYLVWSSFSTN